MIRKISRDLMIILGFEDLVFKAIGCCVTDVSGI